ncbi:MAG: glyoxalase [Betaproteobacteria bacterium HGW-Betaproteobacteria-4]|jgi:lactoylglutathione lyase|nr:MAG: glyoxalase [Betaproteobacteria bacterium HGW-Betaproteobacteria-4]
MPNDLQNDFTFSHVGVAVSDLQASLRFYRDGLGFKEGALIEPEEKLSPLLGLRPPIEMKCQFLRLGSMVVELIEFKQPAFVAAPEVPRPLNHAGLTHLSFRVDDVDAMAERLERLGGTIQHSTRVEEKDHGVDAQIVFVVDPDGTRIELMSYPHSVQFA